MISKASLDRVISHWSTLIENLQASPLEFYDAVEQAVARRQVPKSKKSRIDYKESGALSANREYLHVARERLAFDICGAPFGTGFFVSWWFAEEKPNLHPLIKLAVVIGLFVAVLFTLDQFGWMWGSVMIAVFVTSVFAIINSAASNSEVTDDLLCMLPILGPLYMWLFKDATYYRIDTMQMYQNAIHNAVLEVIDDMTKAKGLRALGELERKPIMREFYRKAA